MSHESNSPVSMDDAARYVGVPVSLLQSAAPSNAEMIAALTEVHSWARDLPIPTPGTISAMQKVRVVRDALAAAPVAAQAGQVAVPETIHCREFHELAMDYRAAPVFGAHQAYAAMVAYIDARLGAQASTPAERQEGGDRD